MSVQKQEDEEYLITRFKSQTGFGGRLVSGIVMLVWEEWRKDCGGG